MVIGLKLIPDETYKRWIVHAVESTTERKLAIAGDFKVEIGTTIRVFAKDISFANAEWGARPSMLEAKHLRIEVGLLPLVYRTLAVSLRVDSPELVLESRSSGKTNWDLRPDSTESGTRRFSILPREIQMTNVKVTYLHDDKSALISLDELLLDGTEDRLDVELTGQDISPIAGLLEIPIPSMGPFSASGQIQSSGVTRQLVDLEVSLTDEKLSATVTGNVSDLKALKGIELELEAAIPSLAGLPEFSESALEEPIPFEIQGSLHAESSITGLTEIDFEVNSENIGGSIKGTVEDLTTLGGVDAELSIDATSVEEIGKLTGAELSPAGPVVMNAQLNVKEDYLTFEPLNITVGTSSISGTLQLPLTMDKVQGRLASEHLDLNELFDIDPAIDASTARDSDVVANNEVDEFEDLDPADDRLFSDTALEFRFLNQYEIDLTLDLEQVNFLHTDIESSTVSIESRNGRSKLELTGALVGDQPITAELVLDTDSFSKGFGLSLDFDDIPLPPTSQNDAILRGGSVLLKLIVNGQGSSMHDIMSHLNGFALVALRDSSTPNNLLNRFGAGFSLSRFNPFEQDQPYTTLYCGAAYLQIKDGVAKTPDGLAIQLPRVTWLGSGRVNLETERIDLRISPNARRSLVSAGTLANMIQFRGTLRNPRVVVNPAGVATTGAHAALTYATAGAWLLGKGIFNIFRGNIDRCGRIQDQIVQKRITFLSSDEGALVEPPTYPGRPHRSVRPRNPAYER